MDLFSQRVVDGAPLMQGDMRITPQAHVLTLQTPFGGLVWNRPSAVVVERNGEVTRIPILDATRVIQATLFACSLLVFAASQRSTRGRSS